MQSSSLSSHRGCLCERTLLMYIDSALSSPVVCVFFNRSEPARISGRGGSNGVLRERERELGMRAG